ncbi:MAG: arylsulfatase [Planctomycetaceae bacterium]|jgi:arylsulfatase|nr:arylsulfatase [Planctomycetaceae bacterium]
MRTIILIILSLFCSAVLAAERPNIILLVADDMGFSDLGSYGSEIQTPNLDLLAEHGLRFTQFYNTARCWSTRAALMTGYYPQQIGADPFKKGTVLPKWSPTLPHYLKPLGYQCYHSGKWHVNGAPNVVADGGFDHSYLLNDHNRNFNPQNHSYDDKPLPPVKAGTDFYTATEITNRTLRQLDEHFQNDKDKPFFVFTAYTVPHFPLQAPAQDIAKYKDKYLKGWDAVRSERYNRLKQLGIVLCPLSPREETVGPPYPQNNLAPLGGGEVLLPLAWDTLSEEQKHFQAGKMAVHAAMVDRMDAEIGRILDKIKANGAWDNTVIFFLSDNGASAEIMIRGDGHNPDAAPGSAETFLCLGPGWSTASNTPFRRHKVWNHEGGISTSFLVHYPKGIKDPGKLRNTPGHVVDIVPTILDFAGAPGRTASLPEDAPPFSGVSLAPAILSGKEVQRDEIYFEHEGNAALRSGDWKVLYTKTGEQKPQIPAAQSEGTADWALYNLAVDRSEQNNLAGVEPEMRTKLVSRWRELNRQYRQQAE